MHVNPPRHAMILLSSFLISSTATSADGLDCATLPIDGIGHQRLSVLKNGIDLWLELDDVLFACAPAEVLVAARSGLTGPGIYWTDVPTEQLKIARASHPGQGQSFEGAQVLTRGGPYQVLLADDGDSVVTLAQPFLHPGHAGCQRAAVMPFTHSRVLARQSANGPQRAIKRFGATAGEAANAVDGARWLADVGILAGWNRHTHGSEIAQARDWLVGQMTGLGLTTTTESFQVGGTTAYNVIGRLDGTSRPDDWFLVGAHYDSTSQNTSQAAPGAEDNASGCAGVLELARVLAPRQPEATIFFICYSGEEQGLHGSDDHAGNLVAAGHGPKIQRVLTMDMIGYTGDGDLDVLLETEPAFASTLDALEDAAAAYTTLRTVTSLFAFGSDHVPYLNRDLPALLTIENDWDSYPSYHRTSDTADNLTQAMGEQILRMNAAVLADETGANSSAEPPLFADNFEAGNLTAWSRIDAGSP